MICLCTFQQVFSLIIAFFALANDFKITKKKLPPRPFSAMASETKRLLDKDNRPEKIDEHLEDDDEVGGFHNPGAADSTHATTSGSASALAKIRRRQSPPYGSDYGATGGSSATKYGTLDTSAGMKRSLLVDTYPKTHITRKQFTIAFIAFLIFAGAVAGKWVF